MSKLAGAPPPHYRWNFFAFLIDYASFGLAFTFIDVSTVMPALIGQLTDSAPIIGLVSTVFTGGWLLPQLAAARHINDKPLKKPYLLAGLGGRVFLGVIAAALWTALPRYPASMLILFFTCLGLFATADGFISVAWFDILARAIPLKQRGRLMGMAQFIIGVAGIGVGALVGLILTRRPFPSNYALLFTLASVTLVPSVIALILLREPPPDNVSQETSDQAKENWWKLLVNDRAFRNLMICRISAGMMGLATSFYVMHAVDVLLMPQSIIGDFVVAQTVTRIIASIVLGWISERWGPRYVIRIGSAAAAAGPLFALVVHLAGSDWLIWAYPFVYVALAIVNSAWMLGFFNYLLEIAPDGMRPAYVGLGNTLMGALMLAPMAGGWLLEATSYTALFGITTVIVAIGFAFTLKLKPAQSES
ncbi:MAG: MFS transporter [Chloroflexota bacterium]|nr:MFS transporter [Chloroflexota bacterium]